MSSTSTEPPRGDRTRTYKYVILVLTLIMSASLVWWLTSTGLLIGLVWIGTVPFIFWAAAHERAAMRRDEEATAQRRQRRRERAPRRSLRRLIPRRRDPTPAVKPGIAAPRRNPEVGRRHRRSLLRDPPIGYIMAVLVAIAATAFVIRALYTVSGRSEGM